MDGVAGFVVEEGQVGVVDDLGWAQDELAGVGLHVPNADGLVAGAGNDFVSNHVSLLASTLSDKEGAEHTRQTASSRYYPYGRGGIQGGLCLPSISCQVPL